MKKYFVFPFVAIAIFFTAFSCDDNNSGHYLFDIATVEVQNDKTFVLRLDDGTRLWPVDLDVHYTPKDRQRVFVNFTILSEKENSCDYSIRINDIWDILTKSPIL
ncbi:MAG: NigD-like N-terminal domain-containing protein, partial [Dysgonamonadaceae bacterium]